MECFITIENIIKLILIDLENRCYILLNKKDGSHHMTYFLIEHTDKYHIKSSGTLSIKMLFLVKA